MPWVQRASTLSMGRPITPFSCSSQHCMSLIDYPMRCRDDWTPHALPGRWAKVNTDSSTTRSVLMIGNASDTEVGHGGHLNSWVVLVRMVVQHFEACSGAPHPAAYVLPSLQLCTSNSVELCWPAALQANRAVVKARADAKPNTAAAKSKGAAAKPKDRRQAHNTRMTLWRELHTSNLQRLIPPPPP
jgi:hypothetical protein